MANEEIFKKAIKEFSKDRIIQNGNLNKDSVKGFLTDYLQETYKLGEDDCNKIRQMIFDYYNL